MDAPSEEVGQEAKSSIEEHITLIHLESDTGSSQSLKIVHAYKGLGMVVLQRGPATH